MFFFPLSIDHSGNGCNSAANSLYEPEDNSLEIIVIVEIVAYF